MPPKFRCIFAILKVLKFKFACCNDTHAFCNFLGLLYDDTFWWTVWSSNPGTDKKRFSSPIRAYRLRFPPSLLFNVYWGYFLGIKRPEHDVDHSTPSSAEVKHERSCTSIPHTCLHGVDTDNFTFYCCNIILTSVIWSSKCFLTKTPYAFLLSPISVLTHICQMPRSSFSFTL